MTPEKEMRESLDEVNGLIGTNFSLVVTKHLTGERGPMAEAFHDTYRDEFELTIKEDGLHCPEEHWTAAFNCWVGFFRGWFMGQSALRVSRDTIAETNLRDA